MEQAAFWDQIAEKYAQQPVGNKEAYEATLARVRHYLTPDMDVLEIGCGTGTTALKLAGSARSILGTDVSAEMVRIAQGKSLDAGSVQFEQASAALAGQGRRFDAVMAFNLIHLVEDRAAVLRNVRARLPEGGLFFSKTPCLGGKPWFGPLIWALALVGKAPRPVWRLRPAQVEDEIRAAGFEIVETAGLPKRLPNHFVVARAV